ncbi:hypothetical protein IU449_27635 [Nocardia higoensis]|uniref:Ribbon-helix-helix protein CopG domain-containing protein n=1 Tax=Nocardia higoensis TaxID=228599 RepID=A0ABS0DMJ5_9NOCA|nr:hypothetical protein [Nocardia higoensis]MBF6358274.1 hypothetical protein [Nocardia higoensis]
MAFQLSARRTHEFIQRSSACLSSIFRYRELALTTMARPVSMPPSKLSGVRLSIDLLEACDEAIRERGLTKREFFERALRRELVLGQPEPEAPGQEALDLDVDRKECA